MNPKLEILDEISRKWNYTYNEKKFQHNWTNNHRFMNGQRFIDFC